MGRKIKVREVKQLLLFDIEWLKATRMLLNLSMEDVAQMMYVNKGTISHIEAGKCNNQSTILLYELVLRQLIKDWVVPK